MPFQDGKKVTSFFEKKEAKKLLLLKTEAVSKPVAPGQKIFAELFSKKRPLS